MSPGNPVMPLIFRCSYGTHLLDHLAADGAGFPGGQVAVVAIAQVNAHFLSDKHLEAVHCFAGFGDVDLVVSIVAHFISLLLSIPESKMLSGLENIFFLSVTLV